MHRDKNYDFKKHKTNIPFKIIEKKIYCNEEGQYEGWGLKIFP